jgi:hypothetical protein
MYFDSNCLVYVSLKGANLNEDNTNWLFLKLTLLPIVLGLVGYSAIFTF